MKRPALVLLVLMFSFSAVRKLPAPIQEDPPTTPMPKPHRETLPRSKPKPKNAPEPKASSKLLFSGTWVGTTINKASDGSSSSSTYLIKISDDEKTALVSFAAAGESISGPPAQFSSTRFRDALTWSSTESWGSTTYTLRTISTGTASLLREGRYIGGDWDGVTFTHTGTLLRKDLPSAPSSRETMTIPVETTGIPTAKSVPNRPGYVFDPFDPKNKLILDVRGKASGTKVKDPSGRIFIVP